MTREQALAAYTSGSAFAEMAEKDKGRIVPGMSDVGAKNAKFAVEYLERERIPVLARDLGRHEASKVYFFPRTGRVLVKRLKSLRNDTVLTRERDYAERLDELAKGGAADLFV